MSKYEKFLAVYSGVLTIAFVAAALSGAAASRKANFDEIDVQRINVREADGTLRMVISSHGRFPGAITKQREYPHERSSAGMIFLNDDGIETGGLIFRGRKNTDGTTESSGHLSFDPYDRDQTVALTQSEEDGEVVSVGLLINDPRTLSMESALREMERIESLPESERTAVHAALDERFRTAGIVPRMFVGKDKQQISVVSLSDAKGRQRLRLQVTPDGEAIIQFLDAQGKVQRTLTPEKS